MCVFGANFCSFWFGLKLCFAEYFELSQFARWIAWNLFSINFNTTDDHSISYITNRTSYFSILWEVDIFNKFWYTIFYIRWRMPHNKLCEKWPFIWLTRRYLTIFLIYTSQVCVNGFKFIKLILKNRLNIDVTNRPKLSSVISNYQSGLEIRVHNQSMNKMM